MLDFLTNYHFHQNLCIHITFTLRYVKKDNGLRLNYRTVIFLCHTNNINFFIVEVVTEYNLLSPVDILRVLILFKLYKTHPFQ